MALINALKNLGAAAQYVATAAIEDVKTNPQIEKVSSAAVNNVSSAKKGLASFLVKTAAKLDQNKMVAEINYSNKTQADLEFEGIGGNPC